jgi:hypothetical protein
MGKAYTEPDRQKYGNIISNQKEDKWKQLVKTRCLTGRQKNGNSLSKPELKDRDDTNTAGR